MRKRTILPLFISSIIGGIILILSFIGLIIDKTNTFYPYLLMIICASLIIITGIFTYLSHDFAFGVFNAIATILSFINLRTFYVSPKELSIMPVWMIVIILILLSSNFVSIILSVYRLPINQKTFDNKIFGELRKSQKSSIILTFVNIGLLLIIIISLSLNLYSMVITIIASILAIIFMIFGKVVSFCFKNRIGSLFILVSPVIVILGVNPKEFSLDNTCVLLMLIEYLLSISLAVVEYTKVEMGEETEIGPKEYKK